jgi:hypothetical protein
MANVDNPNGFTFVKSLTGHAELWQGQVAVNNTVAKGDALIADGTAGQLDIAVATSPQLMGIAAHAVTASATVVQNIQYYPALPWYIFEGQCSGTFATTMINTAVDIEGTTGIMEVNENATTEDVIQIIGYDPNSAVGANTRVYFLILRSAFLPVLAAK